MNKIITWFGIVVCILYGLAVLSFIIMGTDILLTIWEIMTIVGAVLMVVLLNEIATKMNINHIKHTMLLISLNTTLTLTTVAHVVNMSVTRKLQQSGASVPEFFQIGKYPSVEMSVDYIAWGLFMGLSFLLLSIEIKIKCMIKITLMICALLCFIGFIGSFFSENGWYFAPMGYGVGTLIVCVEMLCYSRKHKD